MNKDFHNVTIAFRFNQLSHSWLKQVEFQMLNKWWEEWISSPARSLGNCSRVGKSRQGVTCLNCDVVPNGELAYTATFDPRSRKLQSFSTFSESEHFDLFW
jgi:predicted nucleic acid-binding Zn ribbon protein